MAGIRKPQISEASIALLKHFLIRLTTRHPPRPSLWGSAVTDAGLAFSKQGHDT